MRILYRRAIAACIFLFTLIGEMTAQETAVFPAFPTPADTLDAIYYDDGNLSRGEAVMLATLQGAVNIRQPRIYLLSERRGGRTEWADRIDIKTRHVASEDLYSLVRKYREDVKGLIVYNGRKSPHYINLACTIAGLKGALAVTGDEKRKLEEAGMNLETICDISTLDYDTPVEIYSYLYENYWKDCSRNTMISLNPKVSADIRDLGTAMGAAFIWLDPRKADEREVLKKFLSELIPGKSVILGWWHEERAGIGIATSYGLSTVPSDFYNNATVYAGYPHQINPSRTPKRKPLENKVYVALFLSDGDNIQYCEHKMCRLWDNPLRGQSPINWTISPALADLGPGLLNYYYETSTDQDCLVSGPSGMGYSLIYDELNDIWHTTERETIESYTKLTQQYLVRSGLRIITIWDRVNRAQMEAYTDNCRYLQGVTLEDWKRAPKIEASSCNGRLAFIGNRPCYTSYVEDMFREWEDSIRVFDFKKPAFFTSQGESWNMGPDQMAKLQSLFDSIEKDRVEICRADHFFSFYNEANGLDFNILMLDSASVSCENADPDLEKAADGSFAERWSWTAKEKGKQKITYDLGKEYTLTRFLLSHASAGGLDKSLNIREYSIEVSLDGNRWKTVDNVKVNGEDFTDKDIDPCNARYVRLNVKKCGEDGLARIADFEIHGHTAKD